MAYASTRWPCPLCGTYATRGEVIVTGVILMYRYHVAQIEHRLQRSIQWLKNDNNDHVSLCRLRADVEPGLLLDNSMSSLSP